jgi:hypothetical protein
MKINLQREVDLKKKKKDKENKGQEKSAGRNPCP